MAKNWPVHGQTIRILILKKSPITFYREVIGQWIRQGFVPRNGYDDVIEAYPGTSTGAALPPM